MKNSDFVKKHRFRLVPYHKGIEHFNYDLTVDWAIDLIERGIETDNVLMLASFSKPVDSVEIRPYVSAVLADLDMGEREGDEAFLELIHYYLKHILNDNSIRGYLTKLDDLYFEKDCFNNDDKYGLASFYLLYHGWEELEDVGTNYYFEGADLNNIEDIIKEQARIWIDKFITGVNVKEEFPATGLSSHSHNLKEDTGNKRQIWWERLWS